jgi:hypothetical protein
VEAMEIRPHDGLGVLHFGMTRSTVRAVLAGRFHDFNKTKTEPPAVAYPDLGLHLYFDGDGELEEIETWGPARVKVNGVVLDGSLDHVLAQLSDVEVPMERDADGARSVLGIALYAPTGAIEGVLISR